MTTRKPPLRKPPLACKLVHFSGFEIRIIERITFHGDGTESYRYEPRMVRKARISRYTTHLVVGRGITTINDRYSATADERDAMIFDDPDVAQYAAIVATWRWIQDGLGSRAHEMR